MSLSVTSWFVDQSLLKHSEPVRKFTIGSSDYSDRVITWPTFKVKWNQVRPVRLNMTLANDDGALNFFQSDKINMQNSCSLQIGFTHATSGDEMITVFAGKTDKFTMSKGAIKLTLADKFKQLTERVIGTSDNPVSFVGSNYLLSDIAWWLCTSYGGLDATTSTANVDIDWTSFADWANVFSSDSVYMEARFTGMKVTEALSKLSLMSQSAIFQENEKLNFHRFSVANSYASTFDNSTLKDLQLTVDDKKVINRQYVGLDYDVSSRFHKSTIIDESSASVNSYGLKESIYNDQSMWYVNSLSAINYAQRITTTKKEPYAEANGIVPLVGLIRQIGEMVYITDPQVGISGEGYRIMERSFNMHTGEVRFNADPSQLLNLFRLDVSALDSSDVLG